MTNRVGGDTSVEQWRKATGRVKCSVSRLRLASERVGSRAYGVREELGARTCLDKDRMVIRISYHPRDKLL